MILDSCISPDNSTLATLCTDETLRLWNMFESFSDLEKLQKPKASKLTLGASSVIR